MREASRNVELGRPCDRGPANQLFSFVVPPSSFLVRVHAEAAGPTARRQIANIPGPCELCAVDHGKGDADVPRLTYCIGLAARDAPQITLASAFICEVAILVIRRVDDSSGVYPL